MKRVVMITVLAVLLMTAVGTTTVIAKGQTTTALSCKAPSMPSPLIGDEFQITGNLTDETTSAPVPDQLITVYMLTDEKKWMELGSDTTDDAGLYTVTTRQDTADMYYYKAEFDGDKNYKKVTSATTNVTVNGLAQGSYPFPNVTYFELYNTGLFVAKLAFYYSTDGGNTWTESSHTSGIVAGGYVFMHPDGLNVPNGALVKIHVIVVGGNDKTGSTVFKYNKGDSSMPYLPLYRYYISGTTLNPKLQGPYEASPY